MIINISNSIQCNLIVTEDAKKIYKRYEIHSITLGEDVVAESWSSAVDFAEISNLFNKNALIQGIKYQLNEVHYELVLADKQPPKLAIVIKNHDTDDYNFYDFTKVETLLIYNKLTKILNKCDFGGNA